MNLAIFLNMSLLSRASLVDVNYEGVASYALARLASTVLSVMPC
jgi:hypothetical protein